MVPRGAPGKPRLSKITQNSARIDVLDATTGSYDVTAYVNFPGVDYVKQVFFTAYGGAKLTLSTVSNPPPRVALQAFGPVQSNGDPCDPVTAVGQGLFRFRPDKPVFGFPTYWSYDDAEFLYFYKRGREWLSAKADEWSEVVKEGQDEFPASLALKEEDLQCGCQDVAGNIPVFKRAVCGAWAGAECSSPVVERFCPVTCGLGQC
mmetsp:Transcript_96086/g.296323  ORF Transcript_96086/g.296323 Transcript_96086/m.296323 type:complete len:205 (-) Transcript_96086:90-704(-)